MAVSIDRLAAIRIKNNISKSKLARIAGLSKSMITLAEKKESHEFKFSDGIRICKHLNISAEYLLEYSDNESPYVFADTKDENTFVYNNHNEVITTNYDSWFDKLNSSNNQSNIDIKNQSRNSEYISSFNERSNLAIKAKQNELKNRVRAGDVMVFDQYQKIEAGDDILLDTNFETVGSVAWIRDDLIAIDINDERTIIDRRNYDKRMCVLIAIIQQAGIRQFNVD